MPTEARGTREFSSPEVRVRSARDFPFHPDRRLLLPNERRRRVPRKRIARALGTLLVLAGVGVGVYFGVSLLLEPDGAMPVAAPTAAQSVAAEAQAEPQASANLATASTAQAAPATESVTAQQAAAEPQGAAQQQAAASSAGASPVTPAVHPAQTAPSIAVEAVTPAAIGGAPLVAERLTAEAVPAGIPLLLADGTPYDPADATTAFSGAWPIGTTLRLTRLAGAPLLTEQQAEQVVGAEALVVIRGSEDSNTDIQLSAGAFEQLGFYGTERIIAVRVEVVAPPPS